MGNFITNTGESNLEKRLLQLISKSKELKFLVGFFYFSGIRELFDALKNNHNVTMKVLVGRNVYHGMHGLIEYAEQGNRSSDEIITEFFTSLKKSINSDIFDTKDFYEQVKFFIQLIVNDKLLIRKTLNPNHAKLYLFKLEETQIVRSQLLITGSSNLTKPGLNTQEEFNVEISDYGFEEAEKYFDALWEEAVKINEECDIKKRLIEVLKTETLIKEITPFEAFCLVIKIYVESYEHQDISTVVVEILRRNNYKVYKYQLDAVKQALAIINDHNGVLIADVVGLGKTIVACAVAKHLKARGVVICPPGLIGDDNKTEGWKKYLDEFQLYDWEVRSLGDLEDTLEYVNSRNDIEVIIVDEAHRFRNQDTQGYELLKNICRNKKVILLTATPFNNKPEDAFALLNLFITPKKSTITLDNNLVATFRGFNRMFEDLAYIKKYYSSTNKEKSKRAKSIYESYFEDKTIDLSKVKRKTTYLAKQIRSVIEPVTIRRNRLDLLRNPAYKNEVSELSKVENPIEWLYELTEEQSKFYDEIIGKYFADLDEGGKFNGAIYRPFEYEEGIQKELFEKKRDEITNREYIQQRNLFDIMRRLLVKRFESSFGAFKQSILNFKKVTENVLRFIEKTGNGEPLQGEYILDRDLLEKILELDPDEIEKHLQEYEEQIAKGVYPKKHKRYEINKFKSKKEFINDIQSDLKLFDEILAKLDELNLLDNDPKVQCLIRHIEEEFNKTPVSGEPKRKIVIFSEYADTVKYVSEKIEAINPALAKRTLTVTGSLPESKISTISHNFDASAKTQTDDYDILLSTDKLSEGFNLNRAGMVINYDIPWNPVRVIQRLGRINRISKKVFDSLYIVNFFPTEKGAEFVKSREIAQNKMFLIHNTLGEDSKIFDIDEEPTPAKLYSKLMQNPEEAEGESFETKMFQLYYDLKETHPQIMSAVSTFPKRIKVSKPSTENEMIVFFKKNRVFVKTAKSVNGKIEVNESTLEMVFDKIRCEPTTQSLPIDDEFWELYERVKNHKTETNVPTSELSIERKALNILNNLLRNTSNPELTEMKKFIRTLREDILDYGTLPDYTMRRIANIKVENNNFKDALEELRNIKLELGEDYLEREKARLKLKDKEIIIAIMNKQ